MTGTSALTVNGAAATLAVTGDIADDLTVTNATTVTVKDVTGTVDLTGGTLNLNGTVARAAGVTVNDIEMNAGSLNVTGDVTITPVTKLSTPVVKADATLTITESAPVAELEKITGEETATLVLSAASTGNLTGTATNGDSKFWKTARAADTEAGTADDGAAVSAGTYEWGTAYLDDSATADGTATAWVKSAT